MRDRAEYASPATSTPMITSITLDDHNGDQERKAVKKGAGVLDVSLYSYGVQKPRGVDISPAEELPGW